MDYIVEALVGLLFLIIAGIFKYSMDKLKMTDNKVDDLTLRLSTESSKTQEELNKVKIKLSEKYTTKEEFLKVVDILFDKMDKSNARMELKFDKLDQKFDSKLGKSEYYNRKGRYGGSSE